MVAETPSPGEPELPYLSVELLRDWLRIVAGTLALGGASVTFVAVYEVTRDHGPRAVTILGSAAVALLGGAVAATPWLIANAALRLLREVAIGVRVGRAGGHERDA